MKTDEIRTSFLEFFQAKGHVIVPSDSLVPHNDPTLLFTGAGMNQFKEYFLGLKKDLKRAASSQKCLRTADLDEVGRTSYHHSFFEMLGNFSFGDYFKKEAIHWAWEYLTQTLKLPPERLRVSVHRDDEEAYRIWCDEINIRPAWIYRLGDKSNFWPANAPQEGPNGPCGPCSEIYYDQNPDAATEDITSERFAEIWNLVFTQYDRQDGGRLAPLKNKNIDTGMGLERLACVLQGKKTNYEIDIFVPLNRAVCSCLGIQPTPDTTCKIYAISDHVRAISFALADGVIPSNEGRGYVIRKIIRRALWHAHQLVPTGRLKGPFLYQLVPVLTEVMSNAYPQIQEAAESIAVSVKDEEERFLDTLEGGLHILEERLASLSRKKVNVLPGEMVFELYDTYGFPDELTKTIAASRGYQIDQDGFEKLMEEQRQRAKSASPISSRIFVSSALAERLATLPPTRFLGYETLTAKGRVLLAEMKGEKGILVLDQTPFYGESGGQVGDQGILEADNFRAKVIDTQKEDAHILHVVTVLEGQPTEGMQVTAAVDRKRREKTMHNHTATHLLHAALRRILGPQVRQLGSLVSPDKLRFDYSYSKPLSSEIICRIEDDVNEQILRNTEVVKEEKPLEEARREGAIAFFGEKYGNRVRVVSVPGYSKELCGGTHCHRTGEIGSFVITSDTSIGSGVRRIEALTGEGVLAYVRTLRDKISRIAQLLRTSPNEVETRIQKLQESYKKREKAEGEVSQLDAKSLIAQATPVGEYYFLLHQIRMVPAAQLRQISDMLRQKATRMVYFLASEMGDKLHCLLGMSQDLLEGELDLRLLMKDLSPLLGISGGGRKDLVQAGGANTGQLETQKETIYAKVMAFLERKSATR